MASFWERQHGETAKAYEAFGLYRDMGPTRSLAKVGQRLGKSTGLMEDWSAKWTWVKRVEAYDAHQESERMATEAKLQEDARKARQKEIEDVSKRHAQQAAAALNALFMPVTIFLKKSQGDAAWKEDLEKLSPQALLAIIQSSARWMPMLAQMERLARGMPTLPARAEVGSSTTPDVPPPGGRIEVPSNEPPDDLDRISAVLTILQQAGALPSGVSEPTEG